MLDDFIFQKLGINYLDIWVYKDNKSVFQTDKSLFPKSNKKQHINSNNNVYSAKQRNLNQQNLKLF